MTTKFRIPQEQMVGMVKMMWKNYLIEGDGIENAVSDLEDLPVTHTKQMTSFFHWMATAGDRALERSSKDKYESCSDLEEIGDV